MIAIRITGGLGNQMFEYAFARSLAYKTGLPLKLDIEEYEQNLYPDRPFRLNVFHIQENYLTKAEKEKMLKKPLWKRVYHKFLPKYKRNFFIEGQYRFNPDALKINQSVYLEGYYQSEKYFRWASDLIRKEFTFKVPPSRENAIMLEKIMQTEQAVSLHVRRGDFLKYDSFIKLDIPYYRNAINLINSQVSNPHFFIFSNDISWARTNLQHLMPVCTFVDINDELNAYEDMRLMSACRHQIIANSSFSWWAAWLNTNPSKIVIAPEQITYDSKYPATDLHPAEWIKVAVQ
ncbi:MAG: alpha-1,2-fucosyltransferase [Raineya sp.]|nr:alpha-1,2-fucosyltransferase [Raineya sp.]